MKTIFDHNPSSDELKSLFNFNEINQTMIYGFSIVPIKKDDYDNIASNDEKLLDLAQLLEHRGQNEEAKKIWAKIPDIERQYRGGFDYEIRK